MSDPIGLKAKAAFKKDRGLFGVGPAITYPEIPGGTDLAAGHQIPYSSETLTLGLERQNDPALLGSGIALPSEVIGRSPQGSMEGRLRYRGWERLLLMAMGFENAETTNGSPEQIVVGAERHILEFDEDLQDEGWAAGERTGGSANDRKVRRGPIGLEKQLVDWIWYSMMVDKMTISGTPSGCDISFDFVGYDGVRGAYNSGSWSLPSGSTAMALFQHLVVRLGTRSAGPALATNQSISSFEITVENNLKADDQSTASGKNIEIPVRGNMRTVRLKLEYPRYREDTWLTAMDLDTELIASLIWTGPIITGATPYQIGFYFPSLRIDADSVPVDDAGPLMQSVEPEAHRPITANPWQATDFPNVNLKKDGEMVCMLVNDDSQNYLNEN